MVAIEETTERVPGAGRSVTFEIESVSAAVEMVASGKATRIGVCSLVHADEVLAECEGRARLRGVVLEPRPARAGRITDIRVCRA